MGGRRKQYLEVAGVPVLLRAILPFLHHPRVDAVAVALPEGDAERPPAWLTGAGQRVTVVAGGSSRLESVRAALEALPDSVEVILVHDGARPLVTREIVDRCISVAAEGRGAVAGWPVVDTLKEVDSEGRIRSTPDRSRIWHAQTPQAFPRNMILEAYRSPTDPQGITDDAGLVEASGEEVVMVEGSRINLKITHPEDLAVAELYLRRPGGRS